MSTATDDDDDGNSDDDVPLSEFMKPWPADSDDDDMPLSKLVKASRARPPKKTPRQQGQPVPADVNGHGRSRQMTPGAP
jgi:hypothetical protein